MRSITRWLAAAGACSILSLAIAAPAAAAPMSREEQWWFGSWSIEKDVWPISKGVGVTVAVIDTGVNASLPGLQGAVLPGKDISISDGNSRGSGDGRTDTDNHLQGHGTGMAHLIAGRGVGTGFFGVAPGAKILPIVSGSLDEAEAIRYAAEHGADVISISKGSPAFDGNCPAEIQQAIGYAIEKDIVVVASAGNEGDAGNEPQYPAQCAGVVAAGAIDNQKKPWSKTQHQPYVTVAAPGVRVGSIVKDGTFKTGFSGTSQAAALTSGVVALVRAKYPQMSAREVVQRIINTAIDAGPPKRDDWTGYGVIIPADALTKDVPKSAPNPVFAKYDEWRAAQPKTAPSRETSDKSSKSSESKAPIDGGLLVLGAVAVAVVGGIILLVAVGRRKKTPPMPTGMGVPQQGAPYGPPPGWGGPAGQPPTDPAAGGQGQQFTPPPR